MRSFGRSKPTPPSARAPEPPKQSEGLSFDLSTVRSPTITPPLPAPAAVGPDPRELEGFMDPMPEEGWKAKSRVWIADLEAKIRILEDDARQRILLGYLKELARFLQEEANLWRLIAILEEDLTNFKARLKLAIGTANSVDEQLCHSAINTIEGLIGRYKSLLPERRGA